MSPTQKSLEEAEEFLRALDHKGSWGERKQFVALALDAARQEGMEQGAAILVCGACGQPWTGEPCGQLKNDWPHPVCYPFDPRAQP